MTNTTKTTKTAALKVFEASKLTAGKYAGIPKGTEKTFMPDPLQTYEAFETKKSYGNDARKFAALTVSQISASGLEYMGFFAVPAGLKAAANMARRISGKYYESHFSFGFDAAGRWSYEFDDTDGMTSADGSAEDIGADGVKGFKSSCRHMPAVVWALASFDVVQLWKSKKGFFFFAVGKVDDGRILLLNSGMEGDFMDQSEAAEIAAAVATYPAAPVAACDAPKADDSDESGENTEKSAENCKNSTKNGVRIEKNAEFGSIEIYFNTKPSKEVRDALKGLKFRWHGVKKCWYGYTDEETARRMIEATESIKADNGKETAQEGENARGGMEVCPDAKTAPEVKETAKRDLSREFRRGDVVKITGTTNGRNGYFYVVGLHTDGTPYKLQGLKKFPKYDTFKDEATKNVEYWPLHTYANSPKVRAEFKEAVKFAKISNLGPVSLAAYQAMKRAHAETVEALERVKGRDGSGVYVEEWTKRETEERADLERMERESESLKELDQWKERHQKAEDTPEKLKFGALITGTVVALFRQVSGLR